jgi:hypothetical protein
MPSNRRGSATTILRKDYYISCTKVFATLPLPLDQTRGFYHVAGVMRAAFVLERPGLHRRR